MSRLDSYGTPEIPESDDEFAFWDSSTERVKNCTPSQLAESLGLTNGAANLSVADIVTKGPVVDVRAFAVVGDGSDETTLIQSALDAANGKTVVFERGKTYGINTTGLSVPAGSRIIANGCIFTPTVTTTSNSSLIRIVSNTTIDDLVVSVPTGIRWDRPISIIGDDINIGSIKLSSVDVQTTSESNDGGVKMAVSDRVNIGRIEVTNYDRAINLNDTDDVTIGGVLVSSYVRGVWASDCRNLKIGKSHIHTASPNAGVTSGHNALLIDATAANLTDSITFEDWDCRDAGEHGIRVGGAFTCRNVKIIRPSVRGCGASGIKVLGASGQYHEDLTIEKPVVYDCGVLSNNAAGIMLQYVRRAVIDTPRVQKLNNANSAYYGVRITGGEFISILNPIISDALFHGISVDTNLGDNDHVTIHSGRIVNNVGSGIHITTTGITTRRLVVSGHPLFEGNGVGIAFESGGTITRMSLTGEFYFNTASASLPTNDALVHFTGEFSSTGAADGSMWQDFTAGKLKKRDGGAWTDL